MDLNILSHPYPDPLPEGEGTGKARMLTVIPPGDWAIGVSGGADSVALLHRLHGRPNLSLHVCHLNHQTRGDVSDADAQFVVELAARLGLPCTVMLRSEVERAMPSLPTNPSARYRAARLEMFRRVVDRYELAGVLLAHHADDQAETVLQRLLRGVGPSALGGMAADESVAGLRIVRPALGLASAELRDASLAWREDQSNASPTYLRSRLRVLLRTRPALRDSLLEMSANCRAINGWADREAVELPERFAAETLAQLPLPLARASARRWLRGRGVPADRIDAAACGRLIALAADAATPPRQQFPGAITVRRQRGFISSSGRS